MIILGLSSTTISLLDQEWDGLRKKSCRVSDFGKFLGFGFRDEKKSGFRASNNPALDISAEKNGRTNGHA